MNYCCKDVAENSELKKEPQLNACLFQQFLRVIVKNYTQAFEAIAKELGQVVVEVFVNKL